LLEDDELAVREATAFTFRRLSVNDDGCQRMVQNQVPEFMIQSFIKHSDDSIIASSDAQYLIHLLEAFVNLTFSDLGIEPLLGKEATFQFTKVFSEHYVMKTLGEHHSKVAELCLRVIGNISINHEGKQECIDNLVIEKAYHWMKINENRTYN